MSIISSAICQVLLIVPNNLFWLSLFTFKNGAMSIVPYISYLAALDFDIFNISCFKRSFKELTFSSKACSSSCDMSFNQYLFCISTALFFISIISGRTLFHSCFCHFGNKYIINDNNKVPLAATAAVICQPMSKLYLVCQLYPKIKKFPWNHYVNLFFCNVTLRVSKRGDRPSFFIPPSLKTQGGGLRGWVTLKKLKNLKIQGCQGPSGMS